MRHAAAVERQRESGMMRRMMQLPAAQAQQRALSCTLLDRLLLPHPPGGLRGAVREASTTLQAAAALPCVADAHQPRGPVRRWASSQLRSCRAAGPAAAAWHHADEALHWRTACLRHSSLPACQQHGLGAWVAAPSARRLASTQRSATPPAPQAAPEQGRPGGGQAPTAGASPPAASSSSSSFLQGLPTALTVARVVAIPFVIAAWYAPVPWSTAAVTGLFIAASITDWLDGYLARKLNAASPFGAFLDPVADKLMVATVLVLLSTQPVASGPLAGNTWLIPCCTLAIISREITMSALREWAASVGGKAKQAVAVSSLGKWKTATQMVSLALLLAVRDGRGLAEGGTLAAFASTAGPALLLVASWLTLLSLADYIKALWPHLAASSSSS